jgi:hypothetical protein
MAVNISIYNNNNTSTQSVQVSFEGEILAGVDDANNVTDVSYFFRLATGARDTDNITLPHKIVRSLSSLALNDQKQSATNTANAYTDIRSMIVDYTYDYIYGHTADQYSSGVTEQKPMKF